MAFDYTQASGYSLSSQTEALNKIDKAFDRALDREDRIIGHQMKEIGLAEAQRRHTNALKEDALQEEARLQRDAFVQSGIENLKNLDPESDTFIEDYSDLVTSMPTGALSAPQFDIMSKSLLQRNRDWMRNEARVEQAKVRRNDQLVKMVLPSLDDVERLDFMDRVSSGVPLDDAIDSAMGSAYNRKFGDVSTELTTMGFTPELIAGMSQGFAEGSMTEKAAVINRLQNLSKFEQGTREHVKEYASIMKPVLTEQTRQFDKATSAANAAKSSWESAQKKLDKANEGRRGSGDPAQLSREVNEAKIVYEAAEKQRKMLESDLEKNTAAYKNVASRFQTNVEIESNLKSNDQFTKGQARWQQLRARGEAGNAPTESQINKYPELKVIKDGLANPISVQSGNQGLDINEL